MLALSTLVLSLSAMALAAPRPPIAQKWINKRLDNTTIPANFTPTGGADTSPRAPPPVYRTASDFDFQSLNLALNQEYIELDLFNYGLARFSAAEFEAAGVNADQQHLIRYFAQQEIGHATLLSNILGPRAAKACNYTYPFNNVRQFLDFSQKLTRFGESGVYGFLPHLDSRPSAALLLQSIATEARQQFSLRQMTGSFPSPVWFETGIPQAFAWTLLNPYITHCPAENPIIEFQIFPSLNISNNPSLIDTTVNGTVVSYESGTEVYYPTGNSLTSNSSSLYLSDVSTNRTSLSYPGRPVELKWEAPGKVTGWDNKYTTNTTAGRPRFAAWVNQLNVTYTPLTNVSLSSRTATTLQPGGEVFGNGSAPIVNGTTFVLLTDSNLYVTPYNLTLINPHVVAGPALYQAD